MSVNLSDNAHRVLEARYLRRSPSGGFAETPEQLFRRVARAVASAGAPYSGTAAARSWEEAFFEAMASLDFLPNSPTLMNAGTPLGQLSACFVLPVEDSLASIFDALKLMALIQQSGGGTGFSFSRLRPKGDIVASTGGPSSGPVSFMLVFDAATGSIHRGGRRRGANISHELQVRGSLTALTEIPAPIKELFQTALEIAPEHHLRIQAAFQRHVDNAVSKTVNLPEQAHEEDVMYVYRRAFELGLKGVTVYRYGSKAQQVLTLGADDNALSCEHFARCDPHACRL